MTRSLNCRSAKFVASRARSNRREQQRAVEKKEARTALELAIGGAALRAPARARARARSGWREKDLPNRLRLDRVRDLWQRRGVGHRDERTAAVTVRTNLD